MKQSKKIFALFTALVLILSLSTMAYAANAYTYSISSKNDDIREDVSGLHINHDEGIITYLPYSFNGRTHIFDQSQFNSIHLSGLMQAYRDKGYHTTLTIPATSATYPLSAAEPDGEYGVILTTSFGYGTWDVMIGNTPTASGTFRNAPYRYNVSFHYFGPPD